MQVVIGNEQTEPVPGQKMHMGSFLVTKPPELLPGAGLYALENLGEFQGAILILQGVAYGEMHIYGTAFLVSPGLAVCAVHVIDEYRDKGHMDAPDFTMFAIGLNEPTAVVWIVRETSYEATSDCGILILGYATEPNDVVDVKFFQMSTRLPELGDVVMAVGFRPTDGSLAMIAPGAGATQVGGELFLSAGVVTDVWGEGRDPMFAPKACFAFTASTVGAMSGGPVFNADGKIIGIISRSVAAFEELPASTTSSLLWDALLQPCTPVWPPRFWQRPGAELRDHAGAEDGWRLFKSPYGNEFRYQVSGTVPDLALSHFGPPQEDSSPPEAH